MSVLMYLYSAQEKVTPVAVSEFMGISRPCTTALLKRLEGDGYIFRSPSRSDGRSYTLSLTEKGQQLIATAHEEYERSMQTLKNEMGIERFCLFLELIEQSNSILRQKL
ncbi:MAG TPA: MarR family transcriptional regulator [Candidatus Gallacutalibacter pullistercoris]|nr:MarR family transcriptional regulator [Candidatus Gallacutalibacter pullistercoris]